jgi:hypothetical protein
MNEYTNMINTNHPTHQDAEGFKTRSKKEELPDFNFVRTLESKSNNQRFFGNQPKSSQ